MTDRDIATVAESFCDAVDAALAHARGPKGGQQVPFHGDFASAPPSVLKQLEWWAGAMRATQRQTPADKADGAALRDLARHVEGR